MFRKVPMRRVRGFTLIELSISIMIISLIIGSIVAVENQKNRVEKQLEIGRKLDAIEAAMYRYRILNNRLPCPGDASIANTNANFGLEADAPVEDCDNGATISSNVNNDAGTVFGGSVPVRSLGLPDDVAFDPWGRKFTYVVAAGATNPCNFTGNLGTEGYAVTNDIGVQDESATRYDSTLMFAVFSHGLNGHGAYNAAGVRINAAVTNTIELENCQCDSSAAAVPDPDTLLLELHRTLRATTTDIRTAYDDIGRFYNKQFLYTYAEKYR